MSTLHMFGYGVTVGSVLALISVLMWGSGLSGR